MDSIYNPVDVHLGEQALSRLPALVKKKKHVVITSQGFISRGWGRHFPHAEAVIETVKPNPTIIELTSHIKKIKKIKCDTLIAVGGGSVIDMAKAMSVLSDVPEKNIPDYFKGDKTPSKKIYDLIAIPSTAGTGAEVTPFATIWDSRKNKKRSLYSREIFPRFAIIDPHLSLTLGVEMTAISGLDALSHSFESLWNKNATPYTRSLAFQAIEMILETLPPLLDNLNNIEFRMKMGWASLLGGLCISHTKTALAHSISYPLTSHLAIPHGLASGSFLPEILKYNRQRDQTPTMENIYDKLSQSEPLDDRLNKLYQNLDRRNLFQVIQTNQSKINSIVNEMIDTSRSLNNIVNSTHNDIQIILDMFFHKNNQKNLN